jgi:hypothetical protein
LGGRPPRPPLELVVATFWIAAGSDCVHAPRLIAPRWVGCVGRAPVLLPAPSRSSQALLPVSGSLRPGCLPRQMRLHPARSDWIARTGPCYRSSAAAGIVGTRKYKKRIFWCARFPPHPEAGDVGIWGGRSPRPPLQLIIANFLIAAGSDCVRAAGIGGAGK